jgi:hypothetical protein
VSIFLWIVAVIGATLGALVLCGVLVQEGAPQQGAVAAVAAALAVIPYCLARAFSALSDTRHEAILAELRAINKSLGLKNRNEERVGDAAPLAHDGHPLIDD